VAYRGEVPRTSGWAAAERAEEFFMGTSKVHQALRRITKILEDNQIPFAVAGAMALGAHGYERATSDVDLLLTREGLAALKARVLGLGYLEKSKGSKGLVDTDLRVEIDMLIAGDYPGDGKPKPVAFPEPAQLAKHEGVFLPLETLIELKLASGMTAPHRLKDLADVLELIRAANLPVELELKLNPYVRDKYRELWTAAQGGRDDG
jgi:hypothetical protein